ncbi:MAG: hypothetical protein C4304_00735 [candidate division GAL15 bacterium]
MEARMVKSVGRDRAAAALKAATVVLLAFMGFLLVSQARAGRYFREQPEVRTRNLYALATMLRQEREARRQLEEELATLQERVREYEQAAATGRTALEVLRRQLEEYRVALGLVPVEGPGVVVQVAEPRRSVRGPVAVQYQDLVALANELWAAGAEAVAVNGQRVVANSGFSQVGGTILVNLRRLSAPFVLEAIGDPGTLEGALNIRGGVVEGLKGLGLDVRVQRRDRIRLPALRGGFKFEHARPVP